MENKSKQLVNTLNELVEINNDRIEGYKAAMKETKEQDLVSLFKTMAEHSFTFRTELINEVLQLGGEPVTGTRTTGKLYRAWMDIKAALSTRERAAILNSCEYGEDVALETYKDVVGKSNLPPTVNYMIMKQKEALQKDHDRIKALRDSELRQQASR